MKSNLTTQQSQRLIELGVDPSKASATAIVYEPIDANHRWESDVTIFTLSDLLALLPKEIIIEGCPYHLNIDYPYLIVDVAARYLDEENDSLTGVLCPELIDALFELLVWCITNKHIEL